MLRILENSSDIKVIISRLEKDGAKSDPIPPILFNIIADMFAILIEHAKEEGSVEGLLSHITEGGVSIPSNKLMT